MKDLDDHFGRRQGQGMDGHLDQARIGQRHGNVLAVDLVAVGQHRDDVLARRQIDTRRLVQVLPGALGIDRCPARNLSHAGPVARVGVGRSLTMVLSGGSR